METPAGSGVKGRLCCHSRLMLALALSCHQRPQGPVYLLVVEKDFSKLYFYAETQRLH